MIVTLWHRADRGLRFQRLDTALASLPVFERGGPLDAFCAIIRRRATRPYTLVLSVICVGAM